MHIPIEIGERKQRKIGVELRKDSRRFAYDNEYTYITVFFWDAQTARRAAGGLKKGTNFKVARTI